jgi:periplasmic protein TonB
MSYVSQTRHASPAAVTAAVVINGGMIAALILMTVTGSVSDKKPRIITFAVPNKVPPPEAKTEPKKDETQIKTLPPVFVPDLNKPIIEPPINQISTTTQPPVTPPLPSGGILGTGTQTAILDVKKIIPPIAPIFKAASRDVRFANKFQPAYPTGMLQREIEGSVTLRVLIGTDGRVRSVTVISAATPEFAAATERQALTQWRFKPATRGGAAVEDWQTLTVRFDIK